MNHDFQQYATSQAFVLTLSRPMIDLLAMTDRQRPGDYPALEHLNAYHALRRRGFVENRNGPQGRKVYITEEGSLVLELCKRAGLVVRQRQKEAA